MELRKAADFKKLLFGLNLFVFILCLFLAIYNYNFVLDSSYYYTIAKGYKIATTKENFTNWIVITTVSQVSQNLKNFADSNDWRLLIVAERPEQTAENLTCKNCIFLTVDDQLDLNYNILTLIPHNSYTRKSVGYLYAVENGAKFIYDSAHDNVLENAKLDLFDYANLTTGLIVDSQSSNFSYRFINAYSHFGRPDLCPPGFPRNLLHDAYSNEYDFILCDPIKTPPIQQGLINGDPSKKVRNKNRKFYSTFNTVAPPFILPMGFFCPFNSRNTLFHYRAFWALLLPVSVPPTLADIWRGYWAQQLMRLTGDNFGYYGVNTRKRDFFEYLSDEKKISYQFSNLVKSIHNWTCQSVSLPGCILELTRFMADKRFVSDADVSLCESWIEDLLSVGYQFPNMGSEVVMSTCRKADFAPQENQLENLKKIRINSLKSLDNFCNSNITISTTKSQFKISNLTNFDFMSSDKIINSFDHTKNVVLVITFNNQLLDNTISFLKNIPMLQTLYEPWYANVVFCGTFPANFENSVPKSARPPYDGFRSNKKKFSFVSMSEQEMYGGYFHYACLHHVSDMKFRNVDGYMLAADDAILNFWTPFDLHKVHFKNECAFDENVTSSLWQHWNAHYGIPALTNLQSELNETIRNNNSMEMLNLSQNTVSLLYEILMVPVRCGADVFYVPQKSLRTFAALSKLFHRKFVLLEIGIPKILAVLGWTKEYRMVMDGNATNIADIQGQYFWYGQDHPYLCCWNPQMLFMHPIKIQLFFKHEEFRREFCDKYVTYLFNVVGRGRSRKGSKRIP